MGKKKPVASRETTGSFRSRGAPHKVCTQGQDHTIPLARQKKQRVVHHVAILIQGTGDSYKIVSHLCN